PWPPAGPATSPWPSLAWPARPACACGRSAPSTSPSKPCSGTSSGERAAPLPPFWRSSRRQDGPQERRVPGGGRRPPSDGSRARRVLAFVYRDTAEKERRFEDVGGWTGPDGAAARGRVRRLCAAGLLPDEAAHRAGAPG